MAKVGRDTVLVISIASRPSNFGATLFNSLFEHMGMDAIYKPCKVDAQGLEAAVNAIRALGIRGCGVSMPHKERIIAYLDSVDGVAQKIGAVNTIVNSGGTLTGYNTDFVGALYALEQCKEVKKKVTILGAGGAARAVITAAKQWGATEIIVSNRTDANAAKLAKQFGCRHIPLSEIGMEKGGVFFNATPVGMAPNENEMPIAEKQMASFEAVCDVVVTPMESKLVATARKLGTVAVPGWRMSLAQAMEQFRLYTGKKADEAFVEKIVREMLEKKN
jgi:shikimate dehydrogenase